MGLLAQANGNPPIRQGCQTLRFAAGWVLSVLAWQVCHQSSNKRSASIPFSYLTELAGHIVSV